MHNSPRNVFPSFVCIRNVLRAMSIFTRNNTEHSGFGNIIELGNSAKTVGALTNNPVYPFPSMSGDPSISRSCRFSSSERPLSHLKFSSPISSRQECSQNPKSGDPVSSGKPTAGPDCSPNVLTGQYGRYDQTPSISESLMV